MKDKKKGKNTHKNIIWNMNAKTELLNSSKLTKKLLWDLTLAKTKSKSRQEKEYKYKKYHHKKKQMHNKKNTIQKIPYLSR